MVRRQKRAPESTEIGPTVLGVNGIFSHASCRIDREHLLHNSSSAQWRLWGTPESVCYKRELDPGAASDGAELRAALVVFESPGLASSLPVILECTRRT